MLVRPPYQRRKKHEKSLRELGKCPSCRTLNSILFEEFYERTKIVGAELLHVETVAEATDVLVNFVKAVNAKKVVEVDCSIQQAAGINEVLRAIGVAVYTDPASIRIHSETADLGISGVEFGVAETGSVCLDAYAVESRLVSTLTPIHVVFLNSRNIVKGIAEAWDYFPGIDRGYISFITGPSRTADIERVLTIGVHGPGRFIIIAVDEQVDGVWRNG